jgi:hypothetical protein
VRDYNLLDLGYVFLLLLLLFLLDSYHSSALILLRSCYFPALMGFVILCGREMDFVLMIRSDLSDMRVR